MFNQAQRPSGAKDGMLQRGIALLGGAIGVGSAILFTPPVFSAFRAPLLTYLVEQYGPNVGGRWLAVAMAVVTAIVIYVLVKLVIVLSVTFGAAALAARRFPGT